MVKFLRQRVLEVMRVKWCATDYAWHQIHIRYFVPSSFEKSFKFDCLLGADSPAVSATGAKAHVMQEPSRCSLVGIIESARRAVLDARETPVAFFVDPKKTHDLLLFCFHFVAVNRGYLCT